MENRPRLDARVAMDDLVGVLRELHEVQLEKHPDDDYLRHHRQISFLRGTARVFQFYERYLPSEGRILDWGCRHAPDACLIRKAFGNRIELDGCDVVDEGQYEVFFGYTGCRYERLQEIVRLPYADSTFDAIVASGVLEHVPMDYESLKELYRVLRPGGRLIITYLPNRASVEEWWLRARRRGFHRRLYSRWETLRLLEHTGFLPLVVGFQTQLDLLPPELAALRILRPVLRFLRLHRRTACLCAVAEKTACF